MFDDRDACPERLAGRMVEFVGLSDPIVTLENMPVRVGTAPESLGVLPDLVDLGRILPALRFTVDVGHSVQNEHQSELRKFISTHREVIANIHLHDGIRGGRSHMALGKGELELEDLISCLGDATYDGYLSLETVSFEDTQRSWRILLAVEGELLKRD